MARAGRPPSARRAAKESPARRAAKEIRAKFGVPARPRQPEELAAQAVTPDRRRRLLALARARLETLQGELDFWQLVLRQLGAGPPGAPPAPPPRRGRVPRRRAAR